MASTKTKGPSNEELAKQAVAEGKDELTALAKGGQSKEIFSWIETWAEDNDTEAKFIWKPFRLELRKRLGIDWDAVVALGRAKAAEAVRAQAAKVAEKAAAAPLIRLYTAGLVGENGEGETIAGWAICGEDTARRAYGTIDQEKQKSFNPDDENSADYVAAVKAVACAMGCVEYIGVDDVLRAEIITSNPHLDVDKLVGFGIKKGVAITVDVVPDADNPALAIVEEESGELNWNELIPADLIVDEADA